MRLEPVHKRAVAFVDGQNLFRAAKRVFGHTWPNYDFPALAEAVCQAHKWTLVETRFYTGVPAPSRDRRWYNFWSAKLLAMSRRGVHVYSRRLRYQPTSITMPDGTVTTVVTPEEKGIDVRIAIDVIRAVLSGTCDVVLIFSQDQDLSELCHEIPVIAEQQSRWIKVACALPHGEASTNRRGIERSDWFRIERHMYDACLDPKDHRVRS